MLKLTESKFTETLPFVFDEERDSENPTIVWMHVLSPAVSASHLSQLAACQERRGKQEIINSERFLSRRRLKVLDSIDSIENVDIEDKHFDKITKAENEKEVLSFIKRLDNAQFEEIYEASDNYSILSERSKKK